MRHTFHAITPGLANGRRCDEAGRVWSSAGHGMRCLAPDGALLGKIRTGVTVANLTFGGRNRSRLFLCASHAMLAIDTNTRGASWR